MQWILDRLKEPSTWAGVAAACATIGHAIPGVPGQVVTWVGSSLAALLAIVVPEKH